jgi:hypothetical protein
VKPVRSLPILKINGLKITLPADLGNTQGPSGD